MVKEDLSRADALITIVLNGARQPEERPVAGPLLLNLRLPKTRLRRRQNIAEEVFHRNMFSYVREVRDV